MNQAHIAILPEIRMVTEIERHFEARPHVRGTGTVGLHRPRPVKGRGQHAPREPAAYLWGIGLPQRLPEARARGRNVWHGCRARSLRRAGWRLGRERPGGWRAKVAQRSMLPQAGYTPQLGSAQLVQF